MSDYAYLRKRLQNVGLSRSHAYTLHQYFAYQVRAQGHAGAVSFFKRVGDGIICALSTRDVKPQWVGTAFKYPRKVSFLRGYSEEVQLRVAKIARSIVYTKLRPEQVDKTLTAVITPYSGSESGLKRLTELIELGMTSIRKDVPEVGFNYPTIGRTFRKVMSVSGPTPVTMEPPLKESLDLISGTVFTQLPYIEKMWEPAWVDHMIVPGDRVPDVVGEIHAAQEGGGKLRMFASPYTAFQLALTPLHEALAAFRKNLRTDCTYKQSEGASWAQNLMSRGVKVCSVDLSSATCRFPLEPQIKMLELMGIPQVQIDCLNAVCRGKWRVSKTLRSQSNRFPEFLKWEVGQPLGIRPSMSMFSTAHNLLLAGICKVVGVSPKDSFRVLGDDVVMREELYQPYIDTMTQAGVPISWNKSHVSDVFAEFAGYSITPTTMVRPGQWRKLDTRNLISLAEWLGSPLKGEVTAEQLEAQQLILFRLEKYDPPVDAWSKFLRANSILDLDKIDTWDNLVRNNTTWFEGFKSCAQAQLGEDIDFYYYDESPSRALKALNGLDGYMGLVGLLHRWLMSTPNTPIIQGNALLERAFQNGEITLTEWVTRFQALLEGVRSQLWQPPPSESKKTKTFLDAIQTALQFTYVETPVSQS